MLTLPLLFFPSLPPSVYVISTRHRRSRKIRNNCNKGGEYIIVIVGTRNVLLYFRYYIQVLF